MELSVPRTRCRSARTAWSAGWVRAGCRRLRGRGAAAAGHDQAGPTRRLADPASRTAADAAMESYHQFVWAAHRFQDQPATCEHGIANS